MAKTYLVILFLSCSISKQEIKERPIAPDLKPSVEAIERDRGVKKETREQVLKTLKSCQEYSDATNERFERLEKELAGLKEELRKKDDKIKELEEELSTWKTIKNYFWLAITGIVVYFFLRLLWINKTIIMKLAGIPIP